MTKAKESKCHFNANKTEAERRGAKNRDFNDETRSQLLNLQLWFTGEGAALQEVSFILFIFVTSFFFFSPPHNSFIFFIKRCASPWRGEAHYSCAHNHGTRWAAAAICLPLSLCVCVNIFSSKCLSCLF